MGKIVNIEYDDNSTDAYVTVKLNSGELKTLQGEYDKVHIFSENSILFNSTISKRGKAEATVYLLVHRELRKGIKSSSKAQMTRLDTEDKSFIIGMINKPKEKKENNEIKKIE